MGCSPPGSSVHGIVQARVLEWGAIAFSAPFLTGVQKPALKLGPKARSLIYCLGEGNDTPLQYSCLENPMDGGAW